MKNYVQSSEVQLQLKRNTKNSEKDEKTVDWNNVIDITIFYVSKQMESFKPNTKTTQNKLNVISAIKIIVSLADSKEYLLHNSSEKIYHHIFTVLTRYLKFYDLWARDLFAEYSSLLEMLSKGYSTTMSKFFLSKIS